MSNRQDKQTESEQQPIRIAYAKKQIEALGYTITDETTTSITFEFKGHAVKILPYSGWHTGKTIQDGRGIDKLLKQIKHFPSKEDSQ